MNRDDLVRETYAHFGLAIFKAQLLEHEIVNAMVIGRLPDRGGITRRDIDAFMDQQFESTLGRLLRQLGAYVTVPTDVMDVLQQALSMRNWLAHNYFRERAEDFVTKAGCYRMIAELQAAQELFDDAKTSLDLLVQPIRKRFGVSDEAIADEVRRTLDACSQLDG